MRTIYKYPVNIDDSLSVEMPQGAQLLTVQVQGGTPCVWAMVDNRQRPVRRRFAWRGTGHDCGSLIGEKHVGTIQMHGGALVFHLFDLGES